MEDNMKTLADLKRQASNYTWEMVWNSWFGGALTPDKKFYGLRRTVGKLQSNSLAFNTDTSKSGLSWLDWPKSKDLLIEEKKDELGCYWVKINPEDPKDCKITYVLRPIIQLAVV